MAKQKKTRERRTARDMWDNGDFEDINSHSTGEPPQRDPLAEFGEPAREAAERREAQKQRREQANGRAPAGKRRAPKAEAKKGKAPSGGRPSRKGQASTERRRPRAGEATNGRGDSPRPRSRPEPQPRKRKKPMSLFRRRLLIVLGLLAMVFVTLFLAESLLLRVTSVRVTGDAVYPEEQILSICGYKTGDNLLFIPTTDREEKLQTQLPYIGKAKVSRRIPGAVVVEITAARPVCCLQAGGGWYVLDSEGKVLEARADPLQGLLQVTGLSPYAAQPGLLLGLEDETQLQVLREILETIDELGAAEQFTRLDMADMEHISLWYQDRVECLLGENTELAHKIQYGYGLFDTSKEKTIQPGETGQLDLTYLPENKTAYFNAGEPLFTPVPSPSPSPTPAPESAEPPPEDDTQWEEPEDDAQWEEPDDEPDEGDDAGDWNGDDENGDQDDWEEPSPDEDDTGE